MKSVNPIIENEIHFVCKCSEYSERGNILYEAVQKKFPEFALLDEEHKFKYLLMNECKLISVYISDIWTIRSQILYN